MKKQLTIYALIALLFGSFTSCDLEVEPTDSYNQETFWHSATAAKYGLNACYNALYNRGLYGVGVVLWEECASPNAYNYDNRDGWNSIALGTHTSDAAVFANRWKGAYTGIGRCNLLLSQIDKNKELSSVEINKMKAEARFLRALYYSVLTTYFYKVPLVVDEPDMSQENLPRTDREVIISFLLEELDAIAQILPRKYTSKADIGRATAGAALALKTRILLFEASELLNTNKDRAKWQAVANAALDVMNMGVYKLFPDYRSLFYMANENNSECIFDVQFLYPNRVNEIGITLRQYNNCAPTKDLVDAYWMKDGKPREESIYKNSAIYTDIDPRFYKTIVYPGSTFMGETVKADGSNIIFKVIQTGFTFKKLVDYDEAKVSTVDFAMEGGTNYMVLRYADILLMYAEAKLELGELTEDVWNLTIRALRERNNFLAVSALTYPGNDTEVLKKILRYERRIELAGEGLYYNDIRRWKIAEEVMNGMVYKHDDTPVISRAFNAQRDYWWPVPSKELELNHQLEPNNPGWGTN